MPENPSLCIESDRYWQHDWPALDQRWTHALDGLPVLAFTERGKGPVAAEVTGVDEFYVYVVVGGEEQPRRLFWCDVRPCAPPAPASGQEGER